MLALIGFLLGDWRVVALVFPLLAFDWWVSSRLRENEVAEGLLAGVDDARTTPEEQELLDELNATDDDRDADLLIVHEWLAGNEVLRRYEYPTRELLLVRSIAEAIEVLGLTIVALTAPTALATAPIALPTALGVVLWLLGGRPGASVARTLLGERLYRTPIDDEARERWLSREYRLIVAVAVPVVAVTAIRFIT